MEKIGTIIRKHRIAQGLTQEELGNLVFVSKQAVSKWETGRSVPDIEMVRKLCDILKINNDEILGGSIEETKTNRRLFKLLAVVSVISIITALFFALGGLDYIDRRTQSGVVYLSVHFDDALIATDKYYITSDLVFEDYKNGYKAPIDYGEICGTVHLLDIYNIKFGFMNTNNWHNIHIQLDIQKRNEQLIVKQTICYETDNKLYEVIVSENATSSNEVSVFKNGV